MSPNCGTGLLPEALKALGGVAGLQLQELRLHGCQDLSTEAVIALCRLQSGLTSLDLSGCSELADGALLAIGRGLGHLWCLRLRKLCLLQTSLKTSFLYSALSSCSWQVAALPP